MKNRFTRFVFVFILAFSGLHFSAVAQLISGKVIDDTGLPLPGAAVTVKEQPSIGAITNADGYFKLDNIQPGSITIVISFIGFETQSIPVEVTASTQKNLDIQLVESSNSLDEIVVVGYGVQRRKENTGSIVRLSAKDVTDMPAPSFENTIQGKAPGVQIITGSGLSASPSVVRIRGISSISAAGDPLYVVDNIPITQDYFINGNSGGMNTNPLATINPNDIESVEILKDASATAIYGSRGANGVILITTKRGKKGGLRFGFNTNIGFSEPTRVPEMLSGPEYLQLYEEAWVNDGNVGTPTFPFANISWEEAQQNNTDWVSQTIGTGVKQMYDFNVQKGAEKYNFYLGGSFDRNESYLLGNSYERLSGRANADFRLSPKFKLGVSTSLSRGDNNRVDAAWSGGLGAAMSTALPIYPIYWAEDGVNGNGDSVRAGDYWLEAGIGNNPVAFREQKEWRVREIRSINSLNFIYSPTNNLAFNFTGSYDLMRQTEDVFLEPDIHQVDSIPDNGIAIHIPRWIHNYNMFATGSYDLKINEDNKLNIMLGAEYQQSVNYLQAFKTVNESGNVGADFVIPKVDRPYYELDNPRKPDTTYTEDNRRFNFLSFFTRINYSLKDRYFVQGTLRADGSSKFGRNKRYGFFPAVGLGWIITEEDFFNTSPVFNYLKLKTSLGYVGSAGLQPNQWRSTYNVQGIAYGQQPSATPNVLENPNLQWESALNFDLGLEFGLWEDRITGELAYYRKASSDVFLEIGIPRYNGFATYWDNVGEILNEGVEFQILTRNLTGRLQWTTNFNIAYNYNEITSLGGYSADAIAGGTNDTRTVIGYPVGTNFLVRHSHVDPETGAPVYLDINGNETLEWDPVNRVPVGKVLPDAIGGITNTFKYNQFELSFLFVYSIGGNIYDSSSKRQLGRMDGWNKTPHIYDRWQQPGDVAMYPRLTLDFTNLGSTTEWINTTLWLHDASYARLRNLTFAYNFKPEAARKMGLNGLRIAFIGTNLLTFTNYPGIDPEIARDFENPTDRNMSPNISYLTPPQERTYSLSLNVSF